MQARCFTRYLLEHRFYCIDSPYFKEKKLCHRTKPNFFDTILIIQSSERRSPLLSRTNSQINDNNNKTYIAPISILLFSSALKNKNISRTTTTKKLLRLHKGYKVHEPTKKG